MWEFDVCHYWPHLLRDDTRRSHNIDRSMSIVIVLDIIRRRRRRRRERWHNQRHGDLMQTRRACWWDREIAWNPKRLIAHNIQSALPRNAASTIDATLAACGGHTASSMSLTMAASLSLVSALFVLSVFVFAPSSSSRMRRPLQQERWTINNNKKKTCYLQNLDSLFFDDWKINDDFTFAKWWAHQCNARALFFFKEKKTNI